MKKTATLILALFLFTGLMAQNPIFLKGDKVVNVGIGIGSTLYASSYYHTKIPPISGSFELGFMDGVLEKGSIGLGGYLGLSAAKWESPYLGGSYGWNYTNFILGARGAFHYPLIEKFDTYAGVLLGYNIVSSKYFGDPSWSVGSAATSSVVYAGFVGGRYYFSEKIGAMVELGYGIAYLNLGIALKL